MGLVELALRGRRAAAPARMTTPEPPGCVTGWSPVPVAICQTNATHISIPHPDAHLDADLSSAPVTHPGGSGVVMRARAAALLPRRG